MQIPNELRIMMLLNINLLNATMVLGNFMPTRPNRTIPYEHCILEKVGPLSLPKKSFKLL